MRTLGNIVSWPWRAFKYQWKCPDILNRVLISALIFIFTGITVLLLAVSFEKHPSFEYLASLDEKTSFEQWENILTSPHLAKWDEASLTLILKNMQQKAENYQQWRSVRDATVNLPRYKHVEHLALSKMLSLAQSYEQAKFIYRHDDYNPDIKNAALVKMADFAKSFEEWEYVMKKTYPANPLHDRALIAMQKLASH